MRARHSILVAAVGMVVIATSCSSPAAPASHAALQVLLSPDPIPYGGRACAGNPSPGLYPFTCDGVFAQIKETGGVGFTVTAWHGIFTDPAGGPVSPSGGLEAAPTAGSVFGTADYPIGSFGAYFSACGPAGTTIAARGTICSGLSNCFYSSLRTFKFQLAVDGADANGQSATFKSQVVTLQPPP